MRKVLVVVSVLGMLVFLATTASAASLLPRSPADWNTASGGTASRPTRRRPLLGNDPQHDG